jgi:hypothetical protein
VLRDILQRIEKNTAESAKQQKQATQRQGGPVPPAHLPRQNVMRR